MNSSAVLVCQSRDGSIRRSREEILAMTPEQRRLEFENAGRTAAEALQYKAVLFVLGEQCGDDWSWVAAPLAKGLRKIGSGCLAAEAFLAFRKPKEIEFFVGLPLDEQRRLAASKDEPETKSLIEKAIASKKKPAKKAMQPKLVPDKTHRTLKIGPFERSAYEVLKAVASMYPPFSSLPDDPTMRKGHKFDLPVDASQFVREECRANGITETDFWLTVLRLYRGQNARE